MDNGNNNTGGKCPVMHGGNTSAASNEKNWWPKALNLDILPPLKPGRPGGR